MLVKNFMTRSVLTLHQEEKAGPALQKMREEGLRRMPVLDDQGHLVGMVSDRRLLQALAVPVRRGEFRRRVEVPPPLQVKDIMNREVATTRADTPLEEAAAVMADRRIGSLVVMEGDRPVGIITETDMFRVFMHLLVGEEEGLRVTLRAPAFRGILSDIVTGLARAGGNLLTLGTVTDEDGLVIALKVADLTEPVSYTHLTLPTTPYV
jgi:acetoin utilization protein AcuB